MALPSGTHLGPYEILAPIGAGGMGEVYRARDARLAREVAIKILPRAFAEDQDRMRRFLLEAQSASALNHPNILVIHDVGTQDGMPYMVSELLQGESLRDRLHTGDMAVSKAIEYARQIAAGLAIAHALLERFSSEQRASFPILVSLPPETASPSFTIPAPITRTARLQ